MTKELYVSSTPHETRLALAEDGTVAEVYFEREKEYSLAGAIYKGRVTRVLPGMQSAFVDIGLERDAFLYVSDFFEDSEEYDRVVSEAENAVARAEGAPEPAAAPPAAAAPPEVPHEERGRRDRDRGRRGGRGRFGFPNEKFARPDASAPAVPAGEAAAQEPPEAFTLPGESLAKYRSAGPAASAPAPAPAPAPEMPAAAAQDQLPAFVLPGESLAKYRNAPAEIEPPTPEEERQEFEHERMQPESEGHRTPDMPESLELAEVEAAEVPPAAFDDEPSQEGSEPSSTMESDPASEGLEPNSASVRAESGEARMQAPGRREGREGQGRGRGRRRRGGRDRRPQGDAPRPAEAGAAVETSEPRPEPKSEGKNSPSRLISDLLRVGQEILVQIAKEPIGKKGARITSHLALPGRFLVYMPTTHHIGVSRRISSDEERARLKRLILENSKELPGGFIVRTASAGASDEELLADIRLLANQWNDLRQQFEELRSPALLHHDLNLVERTLRDQLSTDFHQLYVDTDEQYQRIVKFVNFFMPALASRVRLYTRDEPMFEHFGIQQEINNALKSKVWLKSGGYIVLNQTEALVAIDVNTGKYVGRSNRLEDTIVKTNLEAIQEIVRQIRLRDLGGIIVIDFIDMDERRNRQRVLQGLEEAMRADRAPSKVLNFNDFGLVALTRKRVKQSLERTLGSACPYCEGVGLVKSPTTVCNEIYAEVRKVAPGIDRDDLVLRVNPEIAKTLKFQGGQRVREMEELTRKAISIRPDPQVHQEQFEIY